VPHNQFHPSFVESNRRHHENSTAEYPSTGLQLLCTKWLNVVPRAAVESAWKHILWQKVDGVQEITGLGLIQAKRCTADPGVSHFGIPDHLTDRKNL